MINYPRIAVIFFLVFCASCHTTPKAASWVYTLRTEYPAYTDNYPADEVAASIKKALSEREFHCVLNYDNGLFYLETQWREITTSLDTFLNLARRFSGETDNYTTDIKYYFIIGETYYSVRAVTRNRDGDPGKEPPPNGVAGVLPSSQSWRYLEILAQEINQKIGVTRYNLKTKRELL
jgi:hypothetical protein